MINQNLGVKIYVNPPAITNVKLTVNLGAPSGSAAQVINQVPIGLINGANALFTSLSPFIPESLEVKVNGLSMFPGEDFINTSNTQIQLFFSPKVGEKILINYIKA